MRPPTPNKVNGIVLTGTQRSRLGELIDMISSVNPTRRAALNLGQAERAFLMTVRRRGQTYQDKPSFRLDSGRGPVVIPAYMASNDGQ